MASIASVSQDQLTNRRKQLRRARRIRSVQSLWRSLFVGGLVGTLGWGITSSDLVIRQPEQIAIEGNHFLSAQAIRSLLPLSYPQSLLQVQPQTLAKELESQGPIAEATVSRQLLPPGLTIQVKERKPVAIAIGTTTPQTSKTARSTSAEGLLDEQGVWMPESSYKSVEQNFELPTLKVIGSSDRYRPYWSDLYQAVNHSPVKVFEIDWQNPANIILKTELGKVHLGPYSSRVAEQLAILDRMRELPTHVDPSQIAYIDLTNPESPAIQMLKGNDTVRASAH
ncbi:MAG TPA: FtsQ-type POTRA domain-containing protein [Allocoleopsis sp.]